MTARNVATPPRVPPTVNNADAVLPLLAEHGPCTVGRLAALSGTWRWRVRRRLHALWDQDLVSVSGGDVWWLTARGRARVER